MKWFASSETCFFLLLALQLASARWWKTGENGMIRWGSHCDFDSHHQREITTKPGTAADKCGGSCVVLSYCTHFYHRGTTCHLMELQTSHPNNISEENHDDEPTIFLRMNSTTGLCGWVVGRRAEKYLLQASR